MMVGRTVTDAARFFSPIIFMRYLFFLLLFLIFFFLIEKILSILHLLVVITRALLFVLPSAQTDREKHNCCRFFLSIAVRFFFLLRSWWELGRGEVVMRIPPSFLPSFCPSPPLLFLLSFLFFFLSSLRFCSLPSPPSLPPQSPGAWWKAEGISSKTDSFCFQTKKVVGGSPVLISNRNTRSRSVTCLSLGLRGFSSLSDLFPC